MNILLVCGGSGGHIAPAIAVAERLVNHHCTFAISHKQIDEIFSKKYENFDFIRVNAIPFQLSPYTLTRFIHSQLKSFRQALNLLKVKKIDAVISFGGFTSMGFVLAAKMKKIPIILHESNIIPGKATRFLAGFATKILFPPNIFLKKYNKKVSHVDYPIRQEFVNISRAEARNQLGWPALKRIILIIGGSNGALAINKWVQQNFFKFAHHNIDIFCIAGPSFSEEKAINFEDCTLHMLPFCNNMNLVIRACDLVIARAGAGTIAECRYCKKPMILVPYPFAADNHQWANAKVAEELGVATVVDQNKIDTLAQRTFEIISNPDILATMQWHLDHTFVPDAAEQIANAVEHLLRNKK
ncbi:MAG: UDP-N-acetylglucosamine--N-acetylmuramyl-(pentapeptide) pyrophosphoryl-undecaprenol N-acetylglucosamine transferase [Puniceicoccales bacterium]|jgi:UDP-N-acetylglucosamine--N-acetylmuramyl-(pentapeptide) pyrophosphoryl-undecaprenol N-acetylglucosamine transferase|nr:UDP-N-acetylglucosamine--N-acetylmuramyl-(pentapeptide) pyrophosphoryl-undecaprenol N-acetylglucosamine transferase [Puniceicoccales bacterium]